MVSKHKRTSFNAELSSFWVSLDTGSESSSRGGLSRGVDASGEELVNVLQELGLCGGWVSDYADVDVSSQVYFIFHCSFVDSAKELEHDTSLHVIVPKDGRSK